MNFNVEEIEQVPESEGREGGLAPTVTRSRRLFVQSLFNAPLA
jgi:hypothetical protein